MQQSKYGFTQCLFTCLALTTSTRSQPHSILMYCLSLFFVFVKDIDSDQGIELQLGSK